MQHVKRHAWAPDQSPRHQRIFARSRHAVLRAKGPRLATSAPSSKQEPGPAASPVLSSLLALAAQQFQQQQQQELTPTGTAVHVKNLTYHPPGAEAPLLSDVSMSLPANTLNLIIGRSGSGKTTLLQLLAGLCEQSSGQIIIGQPPAAAGANQQPSATASSSLEERMQRVGLVFQFPERHFLGDTIANELSFSWPPSMQYRWLMSSRAQGVLAAVGLSHVPLHLSPYALSGGQQRRLALAVQLIRQPSLLLLDEPLAGLDWQSRAEVAELLAALKKQCTLLVVSHDLREVAPLVDRAWEMKPGGTLGEAEWPQAQELGRAWQPSQKTI